MGEIKMKDVFLTLQDVMLVFEYLNIAFKQKQLNVIIKLINDKSDCVLLEQQQRAGMSWQSVAGIVAGAAVSTLTDRQCERITYCMCYPGEEEGGRTTVYELFYNHLMAILQRKCQELRPTYKQKL